MPNKLISVSRPLMGQAAASLITLLFMMEGAFAIPAIPPATSTVECTALNGTPVDDTNGCAVGRSTATVGIAPVALTASAAYDAIVPASAGGFAVLRYSFAAIGGIEGTIVPVDIDFALQQQVASEGPSSVYAFAEILASTPLSTGYVVICSSGCLDASTSLSGTLHVNVYLGDVNNTITLEVEALAGGYATIPANSSSAYADPHIYIDPTFSSAGNYRIALSDGVGNGLAPAVPEPGSVSLMLGGFGLLGWFARRARKVK